MHDDAARLQPLPLPDWTASAQTLLAPLSPRLVRFDLVTESRIDFGDDAGALFRSAFGPALKKTSCPRMRDPCRICRREAGCLYAYAFESPRTLTGETARGGAHSPHPMVLRLETGGARSLGRSFCFSLEVLLLGATRGDVPRVIDAVAEVGKCGLGRNRGRFIVVNAALVDSDGREISALGRGEPLILDHVDDSPPLRDDRPQDPDEARLTFVTRTRLVTRGAVATRVTFDLLLRSILRRYVDLLEAYGGGRPPWVFNEIIEHAKDVYAGDSHLRLSDAHRWSSRQKRNIPIGGLKGWITFHGPLAPFSGLLRVGELIHVGKGTMLGHGRYRLRFR